MRLWRILWQVKRICREVLASRALQLYYIYSMEKPSTYKLYLKNREFILSFLAAVVLLIVSFIINFYAGLYATKQASDPVTDIILNNIRVFDVDGIFVYGILVFCAFLLTLCILKPKRAPFIFKSVALFIVIRAVFINLTHIAPFPSQLPLRSTLINKFSFGGDLFFSGHTGLPFLMALIFWREKFLRHIFLVVSVVFGAVVLLGHFHYSIDVFAAFFITYAINDLSVFLFAKDYHIFHKGVRGIEY